MKRAMRELVACLKQVGPAFKSLQQMGDEQQSSMGAVKRVYEAQVEAERPLHTPLDALLERQQTQVYDHETPLSTSRRASSAMQSSSCCSASHSDADDDTETKAWRSTCSRSS